MTRSTLVGCVLTAQCALNLLGCVRTDHEDKVSSQDANIETSDTFAIETDYRIPESKDRFEYKRALIAEKIERALLPAMRNQNIDMWIVLDRENNYDPLHDELGGGFSGVRAAFIFFDNGSNSPEKLYYGSHQQPANSVIAQLYDEKIYYGYVKEGLTPHLRKAVFERDPQRIGVNISPTLPSADGLSVGLNNFLVETIGSTYAERLVSAELLVRDFRLNRTERETELYTQLLKWSASWMKEALSTETIVAGKTTAADVAWWLRDRARELGVSGGGTVRVVRRGELLPVHDPDIALEPGDIVGIDGGLEYLGYKVDIKRTAYLLRPSETTMPESLTTAWQAAQKVGRIYLAEMIPGSIGHEIYSVVNSQANDLGYTPVGHTTGTVSTSTKEVGVYGHSVGTVAHDIGARVAADIPFAFGDRVRFPLVPNEWVSVEFHVSTPIPEWDGKTWYTRFEETAQITDGDARWLIPIQKMPFLIESAH